MITYKQQREREIKNKKRFDEFYKDLSEELDWSKVDKRITQYLLNPEGERIQRGLFYQFEADNNLFKLICYYPEIVMNRAQKEKATQDALSTGMPAPRVATLPSARFLARWTQDADGSRPAVLRFSSVDEILSNDFFKECLKRSFTPVLSEKELNEKTVVLNEDIIEEGIDDDEIDMSAFDDDAFGDEDDELEMDINREDYASDSSGPQLDEN